MSKIHDIYVFKRLLVVDAVLSTIPVGWLIYSEKSFWLNATGILFLLPMVYFGAFLIAYSVSSVFAALFFRYKDGMTVLERLIICGVGCLIIFLAMDTNKYQQQTKRIQNAEIVTDAISSADTPR